MTHTRLRTSFAILLMLVMGILPYSAFAQEYTIDVNMDNGAWHESNAIGTYARSWHSTTHPGLSICCSKGGTSTTDIRGKVFNGANNMSIHDSNLLSFYSAYGSYYNGEYEITVADGWHIRTIEFDFYSETNDGGLGVTLGNEDEVISTGESDTKHVSMTTSDESTYTVSLIVQREGSTNASVRTSNFTVTVARDAGLTDNYNALLIEAKTQLLGALKLANAVINVNTAQNLITSVSQLSSPYTEPTEGSLDALLDGSPSTFWHSKWSAGPVPNHTHYLQVDLNAPISEEIAMTFTRRPVNNDHITVWSVYGSNNPSAENWDFLTYLYTPFTSNTETITSLPFDAGGYQYMRFYIDGTDGTSAKNRGYGHMSEFQLNPATLSVDKNATYLGEAIALGFIVGNQNLINSNDIGWAEYNQLLTAHEALLAEFVYSFEVDGIYYKRNSLLENTVSVSYRGNLYNTFSNEYTGEVVIPETVTYQGQTYDVTAIDERAFYGCPGLTAVTIPNSITSIGASAFDNCDNLTTVTVNITTPLSIESSTFSNRANATLYVPMGCKAAYEAADYWKEFKEIIEIRGDVNDDGVINLADKEELISWLLSQIYDDAYDPRYDVNKDGKVDVRDALRILEIIAVQQ